MDELVSLGTTFGLHAPGVPLDAFARAQCERAYQQSFRECRGVGEIRLRARSAFARFYPFDVMLFSARQGRGGRLISNEFFLRQQKEHVLLVFTAVPGARVKCAFASYDQRSVVSYFFAMEKVERRQLLAIVKG